MAVQMIEKSNWGAFLAGISQASVGKRAEIEVASLALGDQIVVRRLPLLAISYDRHNDVISVLLEKVDHLIRAPRELYVDYACVGLACLEIVDGEGTCQILTLSDPLALPDPRNSPRAQRTYP
jgi:hypothetical protein